MNTSKYQNSFKTMYTKYLILHLKKITEFILNKVPASGIYQKTTFSLFIMQKAINLDIGKVNVLQFASQMLNVRILHYRFRAKDFNLTRRKTSLVVHNE